MDANARTDPVDEPEEELTALRSEATTPGRTRSTSSMPCRTVDDDMPAELREAAEDAEDEDEQPGTSRLDWRADGPFDSEEVDLTDDGVARIDLGAVIVTPWEGLGLQLQVNEADRSRCRPSRPSGSTPASRSPCSLPRQRWSR